MSQFLNALFKAAAKKGSPLTGEEREAVHKSLFSRETLRERFINVIKLAGYTRPEIICNEWLDKYMQDVPSFVKMLEEYEARRKG